MKPTDKKPKKSEKESPDETSDELLDENINEDDTSVSELSDESSEVVAAENETTVESITDKPTDSDDISSPDSTTPSEDDSKSASDPVVVHPVTELPLVKQPKDSRKVLITTLSILGAVVLIGGIGFAFYQSRAANAEKFAFNQETPAPKKTKEVKKEKACKIDIADTCTITKDGYTKVAEQTYVVNGSKAIPYDSEAGKRNIMVISDYLVKNYPGQDFVLNQQYDSSNNTTKSISYRSFELVNGAMVELGGLVPQITVTMTGVTMDLSDGTAKLTTPAQRQLIASTKPLTESELIKAVNTKLADISSDEKDALFSASKDDSSIDMKYTLVSHYEDGLVYRVSLNASTLTIDAVTGKVVDESWSNGIMN